MEGSPSSLRQQDLEGGVVAQGGEGGFGLEPLDEMGHVGDSLLGLAEGLEGGFGIVVESLDEAEDAEGIRAVGRGLCGEQVVVFGEDVLFLVDLVAAGFHGVHVDLGDGALEDDRFIRFFFVCGGFAEDGNFVFRGGDGRSDVGR